MNTYSPIISNSRKRWTQFHLRALLLPIFTFALIFTALENHPNRRHSKVAGKIRAIGGYVMMEPTAPLWLRTVVGDGYFVRVLSVGFDHKQASNEALELLKGLSDLKWIYVGGELRVLDGSESGINGWRRNDTQQPPPIDKGFG